MNRFVATSVGATLAAWGILAGAPAASAETLTYSGCEYQDYQVVAGTTVVLVYGPDCPYGGDYSAAVGSPTIVNLPPVAGASLVWHQAVGRASADAVCEEGWNPSWAEWMNGNTGGFTCERVIDWGVLAGTDGAVFITINDSGDWAVARFDRSYVFGCAVPEQDWPITGNCA